MNDIVLPAKMPLNDLSWKGIQAVARSGKAGEYWQPGDTKRIKLNGVVAGFSFDEYPLDVFVLGIDHNPNLEGYNHIHFGIGMLDHNVVALCDNRYGKVKLYGKDPGFRMNSIYTNSGGWEQSYMRTTVLGANRDPYNPMEGTLLAALPRALREVMFPVFKYTDNVGGNDCSSESSVTPTRDSLWLLSEHEIYGSAGQKNLPPVNPYEKEKQKQYSYFKDHSPKMYHFKSLADSAGTWCRSPCGVGGKKCFVRTSVFVTYDNAPMSYGIMAGFAV